MTERAFRPEEKHPEEWRQDLNPDVMAGQNIGLAGPRLEQGATYVDLQDEGLEEFSATGDMEAGPGNWYVPKSEVDYQLWNRLIGLEDPERLGRADES